MYSDGNSTFPARGWQQQLQGKATSGNLFSLLGKASRRGFPQITEYQRCVWGGAVRIE